MNLTYAAPTLFSNGKGLLIAALTLAHMCQSILLPNAPPPPRTPTPAGDHHVPHSEWSHLHIWQEGAHRRGMRNEVELQGEYLGKGGRIGQKAEGATISGVGDCRFRGLRFL